MPALSAMLGLSAASVISAPLLPFSALQAVIAEQRRCYEEWNHRGCDGSALPQVAAGNGALEGKCCHQMRRVQWPAAGDGVDQLKICEGEQHREGQHHRQDG